MKGWAWGIQSFLECFFFTAIMATVVFFAADRIIEAVNQWVSLLSQSGQSNPEELKSALNNVRIMLAQSQEYIVPALALLTCSIALPLWYSVFTLGRRHIRRAASQGESPSPISSDQT